MGKLAPIRVLVLGAGSIGMRHLRTLAALEGVTPIAVPARSERAEALRAEGWQAYATLEEGLATRPDGAVVATDTGRHARDAERLLANACPVLVEKPLAVNAADARRVADAGRHARRPVHVACCLRFDPGLRWLHARLPALGTPRVADAECLSWLRAWRPGRDPSTLYAARAGEGGVLLDLVHEIDYCAWLMGPLRAVAAHLENRGCAGLPPGVEETALLLLRNEAGACLTLRLSYAVRPTTRRLRIWGDQGLLEWDFVARVARHVDPDGRETASTTWSGPDEMYRAQAEAWVSSLRGGTGNGLVEADVGAHDVLLCDTARRASTSGRWEDVT